MAHSCAQIFAICSGIGFGVVISYGRNIDTMDQHQKQNANQAVEQFTDSTHQVFRTMAHRTVSLQESNLRLAQNFFNNWMEQVNK